MINVKEGKIAKDGEDEVKVLEESKVDELAFEIEDKVGNDGEGQEADGGDVCCEKTVANDKGH